MFLAIRLLNPIYVTFGRYDKVVIAEASSDEAMAKALLTRRLRNGKRRDLKGVPRSRRT